ncbi:hypothetical protein [Plantibacter sp. MPB07]|uniref:hypothetical protein n=1 Tax=Plantibacter sp. MPB07 TaxID=3388853 RepID=UPI003987BB01
MTHAAQKRPTHRAASPRADYPGKKLGLVGLILAILVPVVGFILSIVAQNQSLAAGYRNQLATFGVIISAVILALGVLVSLLYVGVLGSLGASSGD